MDSKSPVPPPAGLDRAASSSSTGGTRVFRHRKKRRKAADIAPGELWHCSFAPCKKIYKRTSSVSITKHKNTCQHRPDDGTGFPPVQDAAAAICLPQQEQFMQHSRQLTAAAQEEAASLADSPVSPPSPCDVVQLQRVLAGVLSESMIAHIAALTPRAASSSASSDSAMPHVKRRRSVSSACSFDASSVASARSASSRPDNASIASSDPSARRSRQSLMAAALRLPRNRFTTAPPPASLEACIKHEQQHHQRQLSGHTLTSRLLCMPPPPPAFPFHLPLRSPLSPQLSFPTSPHFPLPISPSDDAC
jgi:hypothetical protein